MKARLIRFKNLSTECWLVQTWGLRYCQSCQFRGTKECGGKRIRETGQNILGKKVPMD